MIVRFVLLNYNNRAKLASTTEKLSRPEKRYFFITTGTKNNISKLPQKSMKYFQIQILLFCFNPIFYDIG